MKEGTRAAFFSLLIAASATLSAPPAPAQLLQPGDPILAIDADPPSPFSDYPASEAPANVLDDTSTTKYLNFGAIDSGTVSLPAARQTAGPVIAVTNSTAYSSHRLVFPDLKNAVIANSMQVADVAFFESSDGSGFSFLASGDAILAVDLSFDLESDYLPAESPAQAIDGLDTTKYLNFGAARSGFIVTPSVGATVVDSFQIITANDFASAELALQLSTIPTLSSTSLLALFASLALLGCLFLSRRF